MIALLALAILQSAAESGPASAPAKLEFPTFEPFFPDAMQVLPFGYVPEKHPPRRVAIAKIRRDIREWKELEKQRLLDGPASRDLEWARLSAASRPRASSLSANLFPEDGFGLTDPKKLQQRVWWLDLPSKLRPMKPLWKSPDWGVDDLKLAQAFAEWFAFNPEAPKLTFVEGKMRENRAEIENLVRWYHASVRRTENYARMIVTTDDGPFIGLAFDASEPLPAVTTQKLDDTKELRLCKIEGRTEPWVLQCVRAGKPLWSRVISSEPRPSVSEVTLDGEPTRLGPYGWKVHLHAAWSGGFEYGHLYVDADGGFLFYFLSW